MIAKRETETKRREEEARSVSSPGAPTIVQSLLSSVMFKNPSNDKHLWSRFWLEDLNICVELKI